MTKHTKWHMRPVKTRIRLGIRKDFDQTAQADLSLRWENMQCFWFCRALAQ